MPTGVYPRKPGSRPIVDLTGKCPCPGSRLTALRISHRESDNRRGSLTYWVCLCNCGNQIIARADLMRRGAVKSCGCLRVEHAKALAKRAILPIDEILTLREKGFTYAVIGRMIGRAPSVVHARLKRYRQQKRKLRQS